MRVNDCIQSAGLYSEGGHRQRPVPVQCHFRPFLGTRSGREGARDLALYVGSEFKWNDCLDSTTRSSSDHALVLPLLRRTLATIN